MAGIRRTRADILAKLSIHTIRDLLTHFPRRYLDLTDVRSIAQAKVGKLCTMVGRVHEIKLKRPRPRLPIVEITLVDGTDTLIISVFHQPWLMDKIRAGDHLAVAGKAEFNYGFKRMTNPFMEQIVGEGYEGKVIPIHPATEKLSAAVMRTLVQKALSNVEGIFDPIPLDIRLRRGLVSRGAALRSIHFPRSMEEASVAKKRLIYEEVLMLQLFLMHEEAKRSMMLTPTVHEVKGANLTALAQSLPFELTAEQRIAKEEILASMGAPRIMNHMLLGDVGTGKTVVAAFALAAAVDSGGQALLLAPTEVLAHQHDATLKGLFGATGIRHGLLTGATPKSERTMLLEALSSGELDVLVGTHAMLEDDVRPRALTLVVVDEQQRFGVNQRAKILSKGEAPDALYLTATPIPRTLALTLFGNLGLSYIAQRPHVQAKRETFVLPKQSRGKAYDGALEALSRGEQVYVVCPLIGMPPSARGASTSQKDAKGTTKGNAKLEEQFFADEETYPSVVIESGEDLVGVDLSAAKEEAAFLQSKVFMDHRVGLLHGGMPSAEKAKVMEEFTAGQIDVLVSTTVIEVGVDVPRATVMIIEDANMFGLSQLHQLRGRVGRADLDSRVYLISSTKQEEALSRLAVLEKSDDGFEIARYDLALRREGDILGNRQSGSSALKLVNIIRDCELIEAAHADAQALIEMDPLLSNEEHRPLAREIRLLFKDEEAISGG